MRISPSFRPKKKDDCFFFIEQATRRMEPLVRWASFAFRCWGLDAMVNGLIRFFALFSRVRAGLSANYAQAFGSANAWLAKNRRLASRLVPLAFGGFFA
jgi:hypothetical protein